MTDEVKQKLSELAQQGGDDGLLPNVLLGLINANDKANAEIAEIKQALADGNESIVAKQNELLESNKKATTEIAALKESLDNGNKDIATKQTEATSALKENATDLASQLKRAQIENRVFGIFALLGIVAILVIVYLFVFAA